MVARIDASNGENIFIIKVLLLMVYNWLYCILSPPSRLAMQRERI
jgi:hypothetical protein